MKAVFGSRGSDLALAQTTALINVFKDAHPGVEVELRVIRTTGDNKPDASLEEIGGLGAFTREIELALLDGEIDAAVHSLKDLPTRQPEGLKVAAVAGRQNPGDALVSNHGYTLDSLPDGAAVGTSSLRRKAQLLAARPDLNIRELRGNVPTRLGHVRDGALDAAVLALAGLIRLRLDREPGLWEIPLERMLPAPGQGALAVETRCGDATVRELLATLHDTDAAIAVECERAALQAFGGGCRAPLGVYAHKQDASVVIQAFAADMNTGRTVRLSSVVPIDEATQTGCKIGALLRQKLQEYVSDGASTRETAPCDTQAFIPSPMRSASLRT